MIRSKKQMYMAISAFALILLLVGTTVAFFNYTRTGTANTIRTGRIAFNTEQGDTVTLSDLFPIQNTGNITSSTPGVGILSIHVTGDTTYESGLEYKVTAVNVTSASTDNELPISIEISYDANGQGKTVGEEDEDYFDNRGGNSSIYKLLSTDTITDGGDILVGYIASGETGIDGNINIIAYLDAANIAITDTIEDGDIEVPGYTNGTDTDWINGRTVFTTEEWNALQANGVSFQIKIEANEGVWVEEPLPTAAETIGALLTETNAGGNKIFTGENPDNYVWFNNEQWRIIGVYGNNVKIIKATPSTTEQKWQNSEFDGNVWSGSLMQSTYLYNTYWPTLSAIAQGMVEQSATWNVGACVHDIAAQAAYTCASSTTWTGKIGLIATYEYLYAAENDGTCWSQSGYSYDGYGGLTDCKAKDWLFSTITNSGSSHGWTLSPTSGRSNSALFVLSDGYVSDYIVHGASAASPVVYLKSDVVITGGNGQIGETNSYKLGL